MKKLNEIKRVVVKSKARTQREEYLDSFKEKVNAIRKKAGYTELPMGFYIGRIGRLKVQDLHFLYKKCTEARNFSETFFYETDTKKHWRSPSQYYE